MTSSQERAREVAVEVRHIHRLKGEHGSRKAQEDIIAQAIRDSKVEGLREAAKAVCGRQCGADAGEVERDIHVGAWFHTKYTWPSVLCPAGPIHDLIAELERNTP